MRATAKQEIGKQENVISFYPVERSWTIKNPSRIRGDYVVEDFPHQVVQDGKVFIEDNGHAYRHFLAQYEIPHKRLAGRKYLSGDFERVGNNAKSYSPSTKPTDGQVNFAQTLRQPVSEDVKTNYNNAGFDYTKLIELYNNAVASGKGVEDAYAFALRKLNPDKEFEIRSAFKMKGTNTKVVADVEYKPAADPEYAPAAVIEPEVSDAPAIEPPVIDTQYRTEDAQHVDLGNLADLPLSIARRDDLDLSALDKGFDATEYKPGQEIDAIRTIRLSAGGNLRKVAKEYCGGRRNWEILKEYNGLTTANPVIDFETDLAIPSQEYIREHRKPRRKWFSWKR